MKKVELDLEEIESRYKQHLDREWEDVRILIREVRRVRGERDEAREMVRCTTPQPEGAFASYGSCGWCDQCDARKKWGV